MYKMLSRTARPTRILRSTKSSRTYSDIPEHIKNNIDEIYSILLPTLKGCIHSRKLRILEVLKLYYSHQPHSVRLLFYDKLLQHKEKYNIMQQNVKNLRRAFNKDVVELFGAFDVDGDLAININEFKQSLSFLNIDTDYYFEKIDRDNNGVIDVNEFYDVILAHDIFQDRFEDIIKHSKKIRGDKRRQKNDIIFDRDVTDIRPSLAYLLNAQRGEIS